MIEPDNLLENSNGSGQVNLEKKDISGIYRSMKDDYRDGEVSEKARDYHFKQHEAYTRYNLHCGRKKLFGYLWQYIVGYGLRPSRVICCFIFVFLTSYALFGYQLGDWK